MGPDHPDPSRPLLVWLSPRPPERTDIANFSVRVLSATRPAPLFWLDNRHDLATLLRNLIEISHLAPRLHLIAQIGNDIRYHFQIGLLTKLLPVTAVIHDIDLSDFSRHLLERMPGGADTRAEAIQWLEQPLAAATHNPLALNAPAHTPHRLFQPLPFPSAQAIAPPRRKRRRNALRLVLFGYLGSPNRRLPQILQAIDALQLGHHVHLTIIGSRSVLGDHLSLLHERYAHLPVTVTGFLPEPELNGHIADASLVLNLRYPSVGEASGTLLRCWALQTPCVVTLTQWYATLPRNTALFVRPEHEAADLQRHLLDALLRPEGHHAVAQAAHRYLERYHRPSNYLNTLLTHTPPIDASTLRAFAQRALLASA